MQGVIDRLLAAIPAGLVAEARPTGLLLPTKIDTARWHQLMGALSRIARAQTGARHTIAAWLGDVLAHDSAPRRGQIVQHAAVCGFDAGTLRNAKLVCRRIPVSRRHDALSWTHHCEVALTFSEPEIIESWLQRAEKQAWTTSELRRQIRLRAAGRESSVSIDGYEFPFRLMRDMRTAARTANHLRAIWRRWPSTTARQVLAEIEGLASFVDVIRRKAMAGPVNLPECRTPVDPSVN